MELIGYRRSCSRTIATWVVILLSGFTLLLLFYWRRDYLITLTHLKVHVSNAEVIVLQSEVLGTEISYVYIHYLKSNRICLYKFVDSKYDVDVIPSYTLEHRDSIKFFVHRHLKYIWHQDKTCFEPIKGLDEKVTLEELSNKPLMKNQVDYLLALYGPNQINVPLTPILVKLFREILSPFYIFQIFSIVLWMTSEYYLFSSVILVFSIISVTLSTYSCRKNERHLHDKVTMVKAVFVLRGTDSEPREIPSMNLVPGDIVSIPTDGCELVADMLLISGSCIVNEASLTGESVPQLKSPIAEIPAGTNDEGRKIDIRRLSCHVLYSGTRVLQARGSHDEPLVKAVVLRTGFLTVKGDLVRTILYPEPLANSFTLDGLRFLFIMAIIAVAGSIYTWVILYYYNFSLGMLIRKSLDIITIIVPPALPVVMTTGLYLAQIRLKKLGIYCINPSAINIAGTLNTIVFDKTGTLTEEHMSVKGVWQSGLFHSSFELCKMDQLATRSEALTAVLAACHSLIFDSSTRDVVGDPLDKAIFASTNWKLETDLDRYDSRFTCPVHAVICNPNDVSSSPWRQLGVLHYFPFLSTAQRQSVVVEMAGGGGEVAVLCKGAPEAIIRRCNFHTLPIALDEQLIHFTKQGYRVLALAWKPLGHTTKTSCRETDQFHEREELENGLCFLGLVVLHNPINVESEATVNELLNADFRVIMATGDNLYTAVSVAYQCGILSTSDTVIEVALTNAPFETSFGVSASPRLKFEILTSSTDPSSPVNSHRVCETLSELSNQLSDRVDDTLVATIKSNEVSYDLPTKLRLVMTGETWNCIRMNVAPFLPVVISYGTVYARFHPDDKTRLIKTLQSDGGNEARWRVGMCGDGTNDCGALKAACIGVALSKCEASIAAPFTAHQQNVLCMTSIVKEGRCSLSTAIGSFKYIVLCSFIQFVTVLLLFYIGNTLTDAEYLIIDLFIVAPLSLTHAMSRPWKKLKSTPTALRLLTPANLASVLIQLLLIVATQIVIFSAVRYQSWWNAFETDKNRLDSAGSYEATSLYYFSCFQYIFICIVLSKGPPFRERLYENGIFVLNVIILVGFCSGQLILPTNLLADWAKLLPLYDSKGGHKTYIFPMAIMTAAFIHLAIAAALEKVIDMSAQRGNKLSCLNNLSKKSLPVTIQIRE